MLHLKCTRRFEAAWQGASSAATPQEQASWEPRATPAQFMGDGMSPMKHSPRGAVHIRQSWMLVTGSIISPKHHRELSQEQKDMMPQIGLKEKLQHGLTRRQDWREAMMHAWAPLRKHTTHKDIRDPCRRRR